MSAVVAPDEEEAYLLAILESADGLDLAEFAWFDPETDDGCYRAWDFQWCVTGDTVLLTDQGRRAIGEVVGPVRVLTTDGPERGRWVDAEVRDFGYASVWEVELERRGRRRVLRCTSEHVHRASSGRADRREWSSVATYDLQPGDAMQPVLAPQVAFEVDREWVQSGIIFGDGTVQGRALVRLYGEKRELATWFDAPARDYAHHSAAVPAVSVRGLPAEYKTRRPVVGVDKAGALWGWLAGYFATDGSVLPDGTCVIDSVDTSAMFAVRDVATALGIAVGAVGHRTRTSVLPNGYEHTSTDHRVVLRISDLPEDFFLKSSHRERAISTGRLDAQRAVDTWRVVEVRPNVSWEKVFCAEVPGSHCFALDADLLTGNSWYTCTDTFQIDQGGRATGKTVSMKMRAYAFPFNKPGQKMLITATELNHLRPVVDAIEGALLTTRLGKEMLPDTKGNGINRQPHWQCRFKNGSQIISRLPNKDGKGVKGQHVIQIELDEAQDYPLAGWIEIVETLNRGLPGAMWRCHGVSKGVRDRFFEYTEEGSGWTVHRPMAMHRPTWSETERDEKILTYGGSRQNIDYKRNIYGEHGDASNSVFVLSRLMATVDTDGGSEYNNDVYTNTRVEFERLQGGNVLQFLDIPGSHLQGYSQIVDRKQVGSPKGYSAYWGGADIGVTNHPSEFLIAGQRQGEDFLELLLRVQLQRINTDDQKAVIEWIFDRYGDKLKAFALDKTGVGFPIWDQLSRHPKYGPRIFGYNFSEKVVVGFEDRELEKGETQEDLAIWRNVVEATTDWLRNDYVDVKKLRLPYDREVLLEFQGQTYTVIKDNGNPYGQRRIFAGGSFHTLDAMKMLMAGRHLPQLNEQLHRTQAQKPVLDLFVGGGAMPGGMMSF